MESGRRIEIKPDLVDSNEYIYCNETKHIPYYMSYMLTHAHDEMKCATNALENFKLARNLIQASRFFIITKRSAHKEQLIW